LNVLFDIRLIASVGGIVDGLVGFCAACTESVQALRGVG
jgi:hypothetical protein